MPQPPTVQTISGAFGELLISPDTKGGSARHFHTTYAIGVSRSGGGSLFACGRSWCYSEAMVVVTNPYDPHWGRPSPGGVSYTLLYPSLEWVQALPALSGQPGFPRFDTPVIDDRPLAERLTRAFDSVLHHGEENLLSGAVNELFRRHAVPVPPRAAPSPIGIPGHGQRISVLAADAGLSRAHYSRKHRRATGLSPLDYRRQARVLAARSMIQAGASLASAAADAGFADQAHMTRQFRQILGLTPAAYRPRH